MKMSFRELFLGKLLIKSLYIIYIYIVGIILRQNLAICFIHPMEAIKGFYKSYNKVGTRDD